VSRSTADRDAVLAQLHALAGWVVRRATLHPMRAVWSSKRVWLPFAAAVLCLTAAGWTGPLLAWVLVMAAFGFCLDGVTLMWSKAGGLSEHRQ
jgi:hypothetical protein